MNDELEILDAMPPQTNSRASPLAGKSKEELAEIHKKAGLTKKKNNAEKKAFERSMRRLLAYEIMGLDIDGTMKQMPIQDQLNVKLLKVALDPEHKKFIDAQREIHELVGAKSKEPLVQVNTTTNNVNTFVVSPEIERFCK